MADTKFTPGPWRWEINRKHKSINLCGGLPANTFDKTVLGFERYGMNGAAPVFHNWNADGWGGPPKRVQELAVEKVGREHHADWFALIDHPNAHLIAAAPELYEALLRMKQWCEDEVGAELPCDSVNAALAKARGEV
ncbi:hypothetical protein [Brucella pituitosa]|uniref:Uncharacterized protein n=1 Tax=Brucella pituitosa TaxID=571256 RepID=A0A643F539_9HYPH|nr:hypothetical protein [Brucella pituitosa]KAB0573395.1 hypothetical protein F7Q93_02575 [Brucella pituitosa]